MPKIPILNFNSVNRPIINTNNKNMTNGQFMQKYQNNQSMWFKDSDRDGVKNMVDCYPFDKNRQDQYQSLFHAGNQPPSKTLQQYGRVYGFSNIEHAKGWQQRHGGKHIYQFTTNKYDLDEQQYSRFDSKKKPLQQDNEYISKQVISENEINEPSK